VQVGYICHLGSYLLLGTILETISIYLETRAWRRLNILLHIWNPEETLLWRRRIPLPRK
jgi:hypothetical protein